MREKRKNAMLTLRPVLMHLSLYLLAMIPLTSAAQTIPDTIANAAFAPVTILEDHPGCNRPGDTAFSIAIRADDLHFRLTGPTWDGFVDVNPMDAPASAANCSGLERRGTDIHAFDCTTTSSYPTGVGLPVSVQKKCFVTERKGTEVIRRETSCEVTEPARDLLDLIANENPQLDVQAEVTICQSLTSYRILDGHWATTITVSGETAVYDGQLILPGSLDCSATNQPFTPRVGVAYKPAQLPADLDQEIYWNYPTFARLWIDNLAVPLPGTEDAPVTLETSAAFFPTVNGQAICPNSRCEVTSRFRYPIGSHRWRACIQ